MEPIKFEPLLMQRIWGGDKIIPFKRMDMKLDNVGESWEISGVAGNETVVANGEFKGEKLNDVVAALKGRLVGDENYRRFGDEFPLLIKFIDAREQLSIQVHPDDEKARMRGYERGKTEMWYVMKSEPYASLRSGLKKTITADEYEQMVASDAIVDALAEYKVSEGDCFFLPSGRIHSIGAGCFLAEIQQTSDVTYRIYDFNRRDAEGNLRQLHTKEAAECIDYHVEKNYRTEYVPQKNRGVQLVSCPFFTTAVYDIDEQMKLDYSELDSFVILIGVGGSGVVTTANGGSFSLNAGETMLIAADTDELKVSGKVKFLETFIG